MRASVVPARSPLCSRLASIARGARSGWTGRRRSTAARSCDRRPAAASSTSGPASETNAGVSIFVGSDARPRRLRSTISPDSRERYAVAEHRLLIIDDDARLAEMLVEYLAPEGIELTSCRPGSRAARRAARQLRPDHPRRDAARPLGLRSAEAVARVGLADAGADADGARRRRRSHRRPRARRRRLSAEAVQSARAARARARRSCAEPSEAEGDEPVEIRSASCA